MPEPSVIPFSHPPGDSPGGSVTDNLVPPETGTEDAVIGLCLAICTTVVHGTPGGVLP